MFQSVEKENIGFDKNIFSEKRVDVLEVIELQTQEIKDFPDEELLNMIDHAYETVFNSFSKKVQKEILERGE